MPISLRDVNNVVEGRRWMAGVFPDYLASLATKTARTGLFPVLGAMVAREPDLIAGWFADKNSIPLIVMKQDQPVGFAVVAKAKAARPDSFDYQMKEFFIINSQRRRGIGREAAELIFKRFSGRWEIIENAFNKEAIAFWRNIVRECSAGKYRERAENGEVKQYFDSTLMRSTAR